MGQKSRQKAEARKARPNFGKPAWTPFQPLKIEGMHQVPEGRVWLGENKFSIVGEVFRIFTNSIYSVMVGEPILMGNRSMLHLSIKRYDQQPIHDWRDLQRIKNELVGPECEGLELYPAESRLMDTSNQFHLWVLSEPGQRLPYGYQCKRMVFDEPLWPGSKQRPLTK